MREKMLFVLLLFGAAPAAVADCIQNQYGEVLCGPGPCIKDAYGKVYCAPLDGDAQRDDRGNAVCGTGHCARDRSGTILCSTVPRGGAATNSYGKVKCYKGCEPAASGRCIEGQ